MVQLIREGNSIRHKWVKLIREGNSIRHKWVKFVINTSHLLYLLFPSVFQGYLYPSLEFYPLDHPVSKQT